MPSLAQPATDPDSRPSFADGQVLGADDLAAEQTYLIAARRRHLISSHTPGIVTGLEPSLQNGVVTVSRGMAVDGAGRELVLAEATVPRAGAGSAKSIADVGIYVQYDLVPAGADPAHPRLSEQADVFTGPLSTVVPPVCDVTDLPDDASAPPWPVLLGVIKAGNAGLDLARREYVGAVGSAVSAPEGTSRIAFDPTGSVSVTVGNGPAPALTVDGGGTTVAGDAVVDGSVTVGASGASSQPVPYTLALDSQPAPPGPSPWTLYRTTTAATTATATSPGTPGFEELRIGLPAPPAGPDPTQQAMSFGARDGGGDYVRTLSVLTDGTVLINGDLHVSGRLATAPAQVDVSDPRLRQALLANFVGGVQAGTQALEEQYTGRLALTNLQLTATDGEIACTVSLDNVGAVAVKNINVTVAVWLGEAAAPAPDQTMAKGIQVEAQASFTLRSNLKAPGAGTMNVLVHAVGSGLAGTTIEASDLTGSVKV